MKRKQRLGLEDEKAPYQRHPAPCSYFGNCGGCVLQDLDYPDQLRLKRERIRKAFDVLGGLPSPELELAGLEEPWRYRNKAELTFGFAQGAVTLGYHAAGSFSRIVDLDDCLLLAEPVTRLLRDVREQVAQTGLPIYHPRTHEGFFRYTLVRHSHTTGRILLCLITGPGNAQIVESLGREWMSRHPDLVSFYWGITQRIADVAIPEELIHVAGETHLNDRIGPFEIRLHPLSFVQPTSTQAERVYSRLAQLASRQGHPVAWDLYCGIGLIGFYLSQHAKKVYGIDTEPHNLELAKSNAALNRLENIEFRSGQVEDLLKEKRFWLQEAKPDMVVVDPPRAGLHPQALFSILAARPRSIGYVSCNVHSLVRDLAVLLKSFPRYRLQSLHAYDMFPQTNHVETLAVLQR